MPPGTPPPPRCPSGLPELSAPSPAGSGGKRTTVTASPWLCWGSVSSHPPSGVYCSLVVNFACASQPTVKIKQIKYVVWHVCTPSLRREAGPIHQLSQAVEMRQGDERWSPKLLPPRLAWLGPRHKLTSCVCVCKATGAGLILRAHDTKSFRQWYLAPNTRAVASREGLLCPPKGYEAAQHTGMFYHSSVECGGGFSYGEYEKRNLFNPHPPIY